ncbi:MAG: VWA domain-containing protein [Deltaproteobacteria bacterium]|nr:VWA domain-containing protein [Deltaproteobacteria bacterium]
MNARALVLLLASTLAIAGCECDNPRPMRRTDSGMPVVEIDAFGSELLDAPFPDSTGERPDMGPEMDTGCDSRTPVENEIVGDPPDMLIVMDVSGSMCTPLIETFPPTSMETKMQIMKASLTSLVTEWDARINFGMMLFPGDGTCGAGTVTNPIAMRNASAISGRLRAIRDDFFGCATANTGATPTHVSLDAARAYYATVPVNPIGRYVLLATDGLPNCGAEQPDGSTAETVNETVTAIEALNAAGIRTYVLGFGSGLDGGGPALMRMAVAGGTSRPYNARSATELDRALDMIAAEVIPPSCTVMLEGATRDPSLFEVSFDGGPLIPRDESHGRGWDYDAGTNTITFYGAECTTIESGDVTDVNIDFGCPGPLI